MRPLALILKNKFTRGYLTSERKFERWKIVMIGLTIITTGLLLAALILSRESKGETNEDGEEEEKEEEEKDENFIATKSSTEDFLELVQNFLPMARVYCLIKNCIVTCSFIPAASNPGLIATVILISDYKTSCPDKTLIEELIFVNCRFPNDGLNEKWLSGNLQLKKLTFRDSSLKFIDESAFASWHFKNLTSLSIIENSISIFRKSIFDHLNNLEVLVIANNAIKKAEADLLNGTANSLKIIQIDHSIDSENTLANITGKGTLPNVLLLSLTGNLIKKITNTVFNGVPNVQSVYLTNSGVYSIEANAFNKFSNSIRQLFLKNNKISSLPNGIFESIVKFNKNFKLSIGNNDWNCDCDLEWLKKMIDEKLISVDDEPRCVKPKKNNMLNFSQANFCANNISEIPTVATEGISTVTDRNLITIFCEENLETWKSSSRKLLSIRELNFRSRLSAFVVEELKNGSVYVTLGKSNSFYTLIWFCDNFEGSNNIDFEISINCVTNVKNSVYLNNFQSGVSYTICILDSLLDLTSPFDCIPFQKKKLKQLDKTWLSNEDKIIFITVLICVLILVCVISVTVSFYVVKKNPKLLKGSKRVIIVNHRTADALILPEGLKLNNDDFEILSKRASDNLSNKDYMTPMSKRKLLLLPRKSSILSRTSSQSSANSYVTGIEPTNMQLMSWRISRIKKILSCDIPNDDEEQADNPPPLPPPRNKSIPSLSLNIEQRVDNNNDKNFVSTKLNCSEEVLRS